MAYIRKIVIFGATGNTGLCSLQSAVDLGYDVTAFVRDEDKVPQDLKYRIQTIVGDATNYADVENAVMGQDAVIIALGTRNDLSPTTKLSEATNNILTAMENRGVKRVSICISAFLFWERTRVPEKYHPITEDHERMLQYIMNSNAEYTAVLPPHITENPAKGSPKIAHEKGPGRTISKYDLGNFLVSVLTQEEHFGKVCGICDNDQ